MSAGNRHSGSGRTLLIGAVLLALTATGPAAQAAPVPSPQPPPAQPLPEGPWPPSDVLAGDPAQVSPPPQSFSAQATTCPVPPLGVQRTAPGGGKTVALTFDDGPGTSTDQILGILTANNLAATFFNIGINEAARPATVRSVAGQGYLIGNHSWSHPDMSRLTAAQQAAEMDNASNEQASILGSRPCFFRPPYGAFNSTTLSLAHDRNMAVFNWSVDTLDWEARGSADPYWVNRITSLAEAGGSQAHPVILFHNSPTGNPATVAALPAIISFYRDRGYTFVDLAGHVRAPDPTKKDISPVAVAAALTECRHGPRLRPRHGRCAVRDHGDRGGVRFLPADPGRHPRSGPAAVSWDGRRVDVFVVGTDSALWHTATTVDTRGRPTTWAPWQSLGGRLNTAPAVASIAAGRLLVTGRGLDGALWCRAYDGTAWRPWQLPRRKGRPLLPQRTCGTPRTTECWSWAPTVWCGGDRCRRKVCRRADGRRAACPRSSPRPRVAPPDGHERSGPSPTAVAPACGRSGATGRPSTSAAS